MTSTRLSKKAIQILEETARQTKRRIEKAERDERIDLASSLGVGKTFMPGFTRPRDLKIFRWFTGGYYDQNRTYENPRTSAYRPYTVFLLESRYMVKRMAGRADEYVHYTGMCLEKDFLAVMRRFNSTKCSSDFREDMDNAYWPWLKRIHNSWKRVKWWNPGTDPASVLQQVQQKVENGESLDDLGLDNPVTEFDLSEGLRKDPETGKYQFEDELYMLLESLPREERRIKQRKLRKLQAKKAQASNKQSQSSSRDNSFVDSTPKSSMSSPALPEVIPPSPPLPSDAVLKPSSFSSPSQVNKLDLSPRNRLFHTLNIIRNNEPISPSSPLPETPNHNPAALDTDLPPTSTPPSSASVAPLIPKDAKKDPIQQLRARYFPTLESAPFWRPLVALTVSTRPLATTICRLAKARSRGIPYHSVVDNVDKLSPLSFSSRMRCMRLSRFRELAENTISRLAGMYGGFVGLRWQAEQRGRGFNGEGLERPLPDHIRQVRVGIGKWYTHAADERVLCEALRHPEEGYEVGDSLKVEYLDEWGQRLSEDGSVSEGQDANDEVQDIYSESMDMGEQDDDDGEDWDEETTRRK